MDAIVKKDSPHLLLKKKASWCTCTEVIGELQKITTQISISSQEIPYNITTYHKQSMKSTHYPTIRILQSTLKIMKSILFPFHIQCPFRVLNITMLHLQYIN